MKAILLFLIIALTQAVALAQDQPCELKVIQTFFPQKSGGASSGTCLTHDSLGNIYVAGTFENHLKIGKKRLVSRGNTDIFIAKYNRKGEVLWVQSAGGEGADTVRTLYISPPPRIKNSEFKEGDIIIDGDFDCRSPFFFGKELIGKSPNNNRCCFVSVVTDNGKIKCTHEGIGERLIFGLQPPQMLLKEVGIVKEYGLFYTRDHQFISRFDLKNFPKNSNDLLFADFHESWYLHLESKTSIEIVKTESHRLIVGNIVDTLRIDHLTLTSKGSRDGFLLRINDEGKITHSETVGGTYDDEIRAVTVTPSGQIWLAGSMQLKANEPPIFFLRQYGCY